MKKGESWDWIRFNDMQEFRISPDAKTENRGYFTNMRVDAKTLPEGWLIYDIMGTDSGCIGHGYIQEHVLANHVGSFLTRTPIKFTSKVYNRLSDDPERNGVFYTTKVKTPVDLREGEVLNWEKKRFCINSYTFGYGHGDDVPLDEELVKKLMDEYNKDDVTMPDFVRWAVEKYRELTPHDAEVLLLWAGYNEAVATARDKMIPPPTVSSGRSGTRTKEVAK